MNTKKLIESEKSSEEITDSVLSEAKYSIGQEVRYKGKKAIIADHLNGTYALWDETGKKELTGVPESGWVPQDQLTPGWE